MEEQRIREIVQDEIVAFIKGQAVNGQFVEQIALALENAVNSAMSKEVVIQIDGADLVKLTVPKVTYDHRKVVKKMLSVLVKHEILMSSLDRVLDDLKTDILSNKFPDISEMVLPEAVVSEAKKPKVIYELGPVIDEMLLVVVQHEVPITQIGRVLEQLKDAAYTSTPIQEIWANDDHDGYDQL
jgi:transcriptional regulator NrdR family protein